MKKNNTNISTETIPRISVVLPTHNRPTLLAEALASLDAQTFRDWEVIIIDDGSTPPVDIIDKLGQYSDTSRFRVVRHDKAAGLAASRTDGSNVARGEIITFLDDDDKYDPRCLERIIEVFNRHIGIDVLFIGVGWFGASASVGERMHGESTTSVLAQSDSKLLEPDLWCLGPPLFDALLKAVPMAFQRPAARSSTLKRIGKYRIECLLCDCDWALRAALIAQCALLQEPLYQQRYDGQGYYSQNNRKREQLESALEMTLHLYKNFPTQVPPRMKILLRRAISYHAFNLAYFLSQQHLFKAAIQAWWISQSFQFSLRHYKLLVGIIARAIRLY